MRQALGRVARSVVAVALVAAVLGLAPDAFRPAAAATVEFSDVTAGAAFYDEIQWLASEGITRGAVGADGSLVFGPADSITREAMAAFIYRFRGEPPFTAPAVSPFDDLVPGAAFFLEITWLEAQGIAPGAGDPGGEATFRPTDLVTREVMALWMYRALAEPGYTAPTVSPFVDVATSHPAYTEIAWMADSGISTGVPLGDGTFRYAADDPIRREAMAAFMYRAAGSPPVEDLTPPAAPARLAATPGDGQVALEWDAVADATGYHVLQATSAAGPWSTLPGGPVTATATTVSGLANGTTYWFAVVAVDASGNTSARSDAVDGTPRGADGGRFDLDRDGAPDLLSITTSTGALWLNRGDGSGGWLPRVQVGWGWSGMDVLESIGDADGDGNPDLLSRDAATGSLYLYPGDGTGGWLARRQVGTGWNVMSAVLAPGDFDGDGAPDVLAREAATGYLYLYPGDGAGGWLPRRQVGSGWAVMSAVLGAGDLDGDGNADVLAREASSGGLFLYPGNGSGGWLARRQVGWGWGSMSALVGPGDLDGDRNADLLAREASSGTLYLYPGNGSGGWLPRRQVGTGWSGSVLPGDATIRHSNPPFYVYGSLRTGQSGYYLISGKIITSLQTRMPWIDLYRISGSSYPYVVPNAANGTGVVGEVMVIKPDLYQGTVTSLDSYERYNPSLPPDNQTYVRELRQTREGVPSWVYVAGPRQADYLRSSGILISSGDFLRW